MAVLTGWRLAAASQTPRARKKPPSGRGEGDLRNTIFARGEPAGVTRAERITPSAQPHPFVRILLPSFCRPKRPYAINLQNATSLPEGGFAKVILCRGAYYAPARDQSGSAFG